MFCLSGPFRATYVKKTKMTRLLPLFISTALLGFSALAAAQMDEPFSPPSGLHPHQQACAQQEILGDNRLPQHGQDDARFINCPPNLN